MTKDEEAISVLIADDHPLVRKGLRQVLQDDPSIIRIIEAGDGEEVLRKIRGMNVGSWNYKGQNPKQFRHYGPMAQDFYSAFGHDKIGQFGNDTTICSGDLAGICLIAIHALEKRTDELQQLKEKLTALMNENVRLRNLHESASRTAEGEPR